MVFLFNIINLTSLVNTPKLYIYFTRIPPPYHFYRSFSIMKFLPSGFYWYLPPNNEPWTIIEIESVIDPSCDPFVYYLGSDIERPLSTLEGQIGKIIDPQK